MSWKLDIQSNDRLIRGPDAVRVDFEKQP